MTDGLRAKFTLDLDDNLSRRARDALGRFRREVDDTAAASGRGRDALGRFTKGLGGAGQGADAAKSKLTGFSAALRKFNDDMEAGHKQVWAFNEASGSMREAGESLTSVGQKALGLALGPEKAARSFQKAFTDIAIKADKLGDEQIESLKDKTQALAVEFGTLPSKVAAGIDTLSAAGWSKQLVEGENLRQMIVGSKLAFSDFDKTAAVTTGVLGAYGTQAGDVGEVVMMLANAVNASKIGMDDLAYSLTDNMAVAKDAGMSFKDLITMQALLGQANIKGGVANTATKNLAAMLVNPNSDAQKQLDKLFGGYRKGKAVLFDKDNNLRAIPEILAAIEKQMDAKNLGQRQRAQILDALFGRDVRGYAGQIMEALTQVGDDGISAWQSMGEAISNTSTAEERLAKLMSTSQASVDQAEAAWENLKITLGEVALDTGKELAGTLRDGLLWAREFASENPTLVKGLLGVTVTVGALALAFGGLLATGASVLTLWASYKIATIAAAGASTLARASILGIGTAMKAAFLAHPVTASITAIAAGALLVYEYWDPISGFFTGLWSSVTGAFSSALDWIVGKIEWAEDKVTSIRDALTGDITVNERRAGDQRAGLASMSDADAERARGLGGIGESILRIRDESRRDATVATVATQRAASTVRDLVAGTGAAGSNAGTGGVGGSAGEAGRGELIVKV